MDAIRIQFKKEGRAKYISHLDLNRCMQRALQRAQIPIWRTQGFNPHLHIVFAMPLSIFYESDCEILDAKLDGDMPFDEIKERLNGQMPEGIVVNRVFSPQMKLTDIGFASYLVTLDFDGKQKDETAKLYTSVASLPEIMIEKATKRSTTTIDMKEYFASAKAEAYDGGLRIVCTLPTGSQMNLNPSCLVSAIEKYGAKPDFERVRRLEIYNHDMQPFL
jgi:radical SAM-linked protein